MNSTRELDDCIITLDVNNTADGVYWCCFDDTKAHPLVFTVPGTSTPESSFLVAPCSNGSKNDWHMLCPSHKDRPDGKARVCRACQSPLFIGQCAPAVLATDIIMNVGAFPVLPASDADDEH